MFGFDFAPRGWATCSGQLMAIAQNPALFSLLGTTYGGNGVQTFALPDLRGRTPFHMGSGFTQGEVAGVEAHTLTQNEMPAHSHSIGANAASADQSNPQNHYWANSGRSLYAGSANATMSPAGAGGNQPHSNMPPYLVVNYCIAIQGIFPSRN